MSSVQKNSNDVGSTRNRKLSDLIEQNNIKCRSKPGSRNSFRRMSNNFNYAAKMRTAERPKSTKESFNSLKTLNITMRNGFAKLNDHQTIKRKQTEFKKAEERLAVIAGLRRRKRTNAGNSIKRPHIDETLDTSISQSISRSLCSRFKKIHFSPNKENEDDSESSVSDDPYNVVNMKQKCPTINVTSPDRKETPDTSSFFDDNFFNKDKPPLTLHSLFQKATERPKTLIVKRIDLRLPISSRPTHKLTDLNSSLQIPEADFMFIGRQLTRKSESSKNVIPTSLNDSTPNQSRFNNAGPNRSASFVLKHSYSDDELDKQLERKLQTALELYEQLKSAEVENDSLSHELLEVLKTKLFQDDSDLQSTLESCSSMPRLTLNDLMTPSTVKTFPDMSTGTAIEDIAEEFDENKPLQGTRSSKEIQNSEPL